MSTLLYDGKLLNICCTAKAAQLISSETLGNTALSEKQQQFITLLNREDDESQFQCETLSNDIDLHELLVKGFIEESTAPSDKMHQEIMPNANATNNTCHTTTQISQPVNNQNTASIMDTPHQKNVNITHPILAALSVTALRDNICEVEKTKKTMMRCLKSVGGKEAVRLATTLANCASLNALREHAHAWLQLVSNSNMACQQSEAWFTQLKQVLFKSKEMQ